MPFPGCCCVVSLLPQMLGQNNLIRGQRQMQLSSIGRMRITSGQDAAPTRTARTRCKKCAVESHALPRETINVGCLNVRMPVGACVIPRHVVGDKHDEIRGGISRTRRWNGDQQKKNRSYDVSRITHVSETSIERIVIAPFIDRCNQGECFSDQKSELTCFRMVRYGAGMDFPTKVWR